VGLRFSDLRGYGAAECRARALVRNMILPARYRISRVAADPAPVPAAVSRGPATGRLFPASWVTTKVLVEI
jgi:hypothetical protein